MKNLNLILIYNTSRTHILMCERTKPPYQGQFNLPGGHIEPGESEEMSAYREMKEETGISQDDIQLVHAYTYEYPLHGFRLVIYAGQLQREVELIPEEHPLQWIPLSSNFFDTAVFAGDGNIGHMVRLLDPEYL